MIEKVINSKNKALIKQKWQVGDLPIRLGHPYSYPDTGSKPFILDCDTFQGIYHYLSAYYVVKKTPKYIKHPNIKKYLNKLREIFNKAHNELLPYKTAEKIYVEGQSHVRSQDISFIKKYSKLKKDIVHIDTGPGLGDMCPTIRLGYNTKYFGVEATPLTYSVQREFIKLLFYNTNYKKIYDVVEAEDYKNFTEIKKDINDRKYKTIHLPSWYFDQIKKKSADLVTSTFMLNELTTSGLCWLISNAINALKIGGYFYIRDSYILKPGCHQINYDNLLKKLGFEEIAFYRIKNRLDFYGIPRLYKKTKNIKISFGKLAKSIIGKYGVVAAGDARSYNLPKK